MRLTTLHRRMIAMLLVVMPLAGLFGYVAIRYGPLATVDVTVQAVESKAIAPALYGIGTVQARYTYEIGPTAAGRLLALDVDVGDMVRSGQVLGTMDPVDLTQQIDAKRAAIGSAKAAEQQALSQQTFAQMQLHRYQRLLATQSISQETADIKQQELDQTKAQLLALKEDTIRLQAELEALLVRETKLKLVAPADGVVTSRLVEPGSAILAGQTVVKMIDPASLWIDARFDQATSQGLEAGLPATVTLRSRPDQQLTGQVLRIELNADAVTEELLAKITLANPTGQLLPADVSGRQWLPPIGELAEITVQLPSLAPKPTIPQAAVRWIDGRSTVWIIEDGRPVLTSIQPGRSDLHGSIQIEKGLAIGQLCVIYSEQALKPWSRVRVVDQLKGAYHD